MEALDPKYFAALRRFDTPTVCNVIELFDVRPRNRGFLDPTVRALYPSLPPIVGYATTATFQSAEPAAEGEGYASLADQVERFDAELPSPRIVVFEDLDDPVHGATYGEVMCTLYKAFGCVGLITSGAARDIEQVERLGFPCFATAVVSSHSYNRVVEVHVPVNVGGVTIRPGDILHADANGVTTIPAAIVREVALACAPFVELENRVMNYLGGGRPTVDGFRDTLGAALGDFKAIPEQVRAQLRAQ